MARKEKADKLGQEYFPDVTNIWARPNYEAQCVANACIKMAEWERKRLVDMAWIRNVGGLKYVKHKDGDIRHNVVSNLEWSSEKEKPRRSDARRVLQLDLMGALVCKYNSIADASLVTGVDKGSISRCCRGSAMSAGGFRWRFEG